MKADKKAAEKEAKVKEILEQKKESSDMGENSDYGVDEESLDPNVSHSICNMPSVFLLHVGL